ncbi:MAG TPA: GatB/YqeY domain-containing protein [Ilumatobacter sp.]|nr:GatB/YqeY domain-containing protein [Ilumatobacter sp.]
MASEQATIKSRLQTDLTASMKARDELTTSTLRMLRSAITNAEVAGAEAIDLTDDQAIAVLQSEAKKRAEAAEIYEKAGRAESAAKERAELTVIERYLPAAMSDEELEVIVAEEVAAATAAGAEGQRAMGQVIKAVRERVGAAADGSRIAAMVKAALS